MPRRKRWGLREYLLILLDCLIGPTAYLMAFYIRFRGLPSVNFQAFETIAVLVGVTGIAVNSIYGLYDESGSNEEMLALTVASSFLLLVLAMSFSFFLRAFAVPRSVILLAWPIQVVLFGVLRLLLGRVTSPQHETPRRAEGIGAQELLAQSAAGQEVLLQPDLGALLLSTARIVRLPEGVALAISAQEMHPHQRFLRRALDLGLGLLGLALLAILVIPLSILVLLDSGRPVFYSQDRVGQGERVFRIHKIRSMVQDAESGTGAVKATANDGRVARVGRYLRAIRLDELPQVLNVLRGEMSIVGPRPERPELHREYRQAIPGYVARTMVRPGLTGLAQVYGSYATDPAVKLQYDLVYIFKYSLGLDLFIILRTFSVLLQPSKARGTIQQPERVQTRHG